MSGNYVINIGRQLGSGGKEIGEKLAARLGIDFYVRSSSKKLMKKPRKALSADCSVCVFLSSVKGQCHVPTV
jgi:hypothetical protein